VSARASADGEASERDLCDAARRARGEILDGFEGHAPRVVRSTAAVGARADSGTRWVDESASLQARSSNLK
jgi:hypothetical protein